MKVYELSASHHVDAPLEKVFNFFSKPENLSKITPAKMGFNVLTPSPIKMERGALIDYTIKVFIFPLRWRTLITAYDPPNKFVDEQLKGPYSFWHHTHTFEANNNGVVIKDVIKYSIPMGILGRVLHYLWIKNDLKKVFDYRKEVIDRIFANDEALEKNKEEK
tara:strand:+ start:1618 stop:2106 length:489 start_codon:yes stop_codon:yes gene_type:complete